MRYIKEYNEYRPNEDTVKRWCDYLDNNYPIKQDSDRFIVIDDKSYFLTGILFNKGRLVNKIFSDIFYSDKMSGSKIDKPSLRKAIKNWVDIHSEKSVNENQFFKKVDISELRKKLVNIDDLLVIKNKIKSIFSNLEIDEDQLRNNCISFNINRIGVDIYPYDDEWFGVAIVRFGKNQQDYFMCDQFEGLIELLKLEIDEIVNENFLQKKDYYVEISPGEYMKTEEYDDNPYDIISKIRTILPNVEYTSIDAKDNRISFRTIHGYIDIIFVKDEYFKLKHIPISRYTTPNSNYYKCDQFEGLIELLKDLGLKLNEKIMESKLDRPNYKKLDIDGFIVYQGKDAKSNDYVTFELSDDEDYWFHAKGVPGSHILIKTKDKVPSIDIIKKAAQIAAKNSKSDKNDVDVVYCKKKFVRKERGMNDGQVKVDYKNSYEITVSKK